MHSFTAYLLPILTLQIQGEAIAFLYIIPKVMQVIGIPIGTKLLIQNEWDKRMVIAISFLISTIGLIMCGPSKIIGFGISTWARIVGWVMVSYAALLFDICSLRELVRSVHLSSGLNLDNPILNERADLWHTIFCSLGSIIGLLLSSGLTQAGLSYQYLSDVFFFISAFALLIYVVANIICIPDHDGFGFGESAYAATLSHSPSELEIDDKANLDFNIVSPK